MKKFNTAIVGATGAVGQEFLKLIEERNFPFGELKMLASSRSAGKKIKFMGKEYTVEETTEKSFDGVKFALFAGGAASKLFAPAAVKAGAVVIDNSSNFRMDPGVPLVVPKSIRKQSRGTKESSPTRTVQRLSWSWHSSRFTTFPKSSALSCRRIKRYLARVVKAWTNLKNSSNHLHAARKLSLKFCPLRNWTSTIKSRRISCRKSTSSKKIFTPKRK